MGERERESEREREGERRSERKRARGGLLVVRRDCKSLRCAVFI